MVAAELELFKGHVEHGVGVGHLFATDAAVAGEMGCRRHKLVDHCVGTSTAVVFLRHFLANFVSQPVGRPRLAFWQVVAHGVLQGVETTSVGLCTSLHAKVMAPIKIGVGETLHHQLCLEVLKVVAGALDFGDEVVGDGNYGVIGGRAALVARLEEDERQPFGDVVAVALLEFLGHVGGPVGAF